LDRLYYDIKNDGIKIHKTLKKNAILKLVRIREIEDEIIVSIGPEGEFIFCNWGGQHRLSIAKILNLNKIPVQILFRHKKWMEFRKEILTYIRREMNGKALHPLLHPDLSDIPSLWSEKRFKIIEESLTIKNGILLDIGAHWGYFCQKFTEIGFQCTAIEDSPKNLYFKIERLFKRLKAKEMYLQVPEPGSIQVQVENKYKNRSYSPQEFIDFIIENSNFTNMDRIGEERNCGIYKLY
jgi:hypothetical protein